MFQKHSWRAVCACFQIRNWLIISKIGGGGCGIIYKAKNVNSKEEVQHCGIGGGGCGIIYKAKNVNSEEEVQHCGILPVSSFHLPGAGTARERAKQNTGENTDSSFEGHDGVTWKKNESKGIGRFSYI